MAALPGTPRTWVNATVDINGNILTGDLVTEAMFDAEISGSMAYLKGQAGAVAYEDDVSVTGLGVGTTTPQSRLHVQESADAYAAIVENIKASGTPHGFQVNTNKAGTHRALTLGTKDILGNVTDRLVIDGDGKFLRNGRDRWTPPLSGQISMSSWSVPTSWTQVPGVEVTIPFGGYWLVLSSFSLGTLSTGGQVTLMGFNGPGWAASSLEGLTQEAYVAAQNGIGFYRANSGTNAFSPQHYFIARVINFTGSGLVSLYARASGTAHAVREPTTISAMYVGG